MGSLKNFSKIFEKGIYFWFTSCYNYTCKEQALEERTEGCGYKAQADELKSTSEQSSIERERTSCDNALLLPRCRTTKQIKEP